MGGRESAFLGLEIPVWGNSCEKREKEGGAEGVPWADYRGVQLTSLLPPSRTGLEAVSKSPLGGYEPAREVQAAPGMGTASQSRIALRVF